MNSKSLHYTSLLLLFLTTFSVNAKDLNPAYCSSIPLQTHGWNEAEAKATLTGIPKDCQKIWCAFALDGSWTNWSEMPITFTPGDTTATTPTIIPGGSYWKPAAGAWPSGQASYKKPGFVTFCLWSPTNTDPKNQDCTIQIIPSSYDCSSGDCKKNIPTYCSNYRAKITADGHSIELSGLNNYSPDNWFAYTDDGWASFADITSSLAHGQNKFCINFSNLTYTSGHKKGKNIEIPLTGTLDMLSDASGPNKCTADNKGGNDIHGIDVTTMPIGTGMGCTHIDYQCPPEFNLPPCACSGRKCNFSCNSTKVYVSKDKSQLIIVSPQGQISTGWQNSYTFYDQANKSSIDFKSQVYTSKSDTAIIDLTKSVYSSGTLKDSLMRLPLKDTLTINNPDSYCESKINLSIAQVWTSISNLELHPSVPVTPNPATPSETITIRGEYASDAKVSIISVSGALIGSVIPTVGADAMAVSLSGLNLQAGIYFIRIESGEKLYSGKLCVK